MALTVPACTSPERPDAPTPADGTAPPPVRAFVAHRDLDKIHFLAEGDRFRPLIEQSADFLGGQIAAGRFKMRGRGGHGAGHREKNIERSLT